MEGFEGFGDYYNRTVLHPVGLIAVLALGVALIALPRRHAVLPMIVLAVFIPSAQRLIVAGADFDLLRILVLFGWIRLFARNEFKGFRWHSLDSIITVWLLASSAVFVVQRGEMNAVITRLGVIFDGLGMYFLFRCVFRNWDDLERVGRAFILLSIPVAVVFLIERSTGQNAFAMFGGVPPLTLVREGRLRCQGAFSHPILAGCFWAVVIPLMVEQWWAHRRPVAFAGIASALTIVVLSGSSTPIMSLVAVALAFAFWPLRNNMRWVRWGLVAVLCLLHLVMKGPVWSLIARANLVGGSTGWHRFRVLDATIEHFGDWWLLGDPNPMGWGVRQMRDITNQFVMEALTGGLLGLLLFVAVIATGFSFVGRALKAERFNRTRQTTVWCLGAVLFAHVGTFFGVSYFGQIIMLIYLSLGMIGSLPQLTKPVPRRPGEVRIDTTDPECANDGQPTPDQQRGVLVG